MSIRGLVFGSAVCLCAAGCLSGRPSAGDGFLHLFVRNTVETPYKAVDDQCFKLRSWWRAREAYGDLTRNCPADRYSSDFREGFVEGYVDYLDAGGNGNPPAAPPARYWQTKYQDAEGVRAVQDWFAGFRLGAEVARSSGYRDSIVVPLSALPSHSVTPVTDPVTPTRRMDPDSEPLPTPRPDPSSDPKP